MSKNEEIILAPISETAITGYRVFRSPTNHTRFNVVAIDSDSNPLFVFKTDLDIEEASVTTEELNKPFELEVQE